VKTLKLSLVLALLLLPMSAFAAVPWTGSPGSSTVDEAAAGIYKLDQGQLAYNAAGSTTTIVARLNVTDTTATGYPNWTTMALWGYDPSPNSTIVAKLFRYTSGGSITNIAGATPICILIDPIYCTAGSVKRALRPTAGLDTIPARRR